MFEQTFKNIDNVLWKDSGCASELDYSEQTSWILFLKYLDDFEKDRKTATSQDFVNWVCSEKLDHNFLKYILLAESNTFRRSSSGAVHQTIYFPEVKAFHICHPSLAEQQRIVATLDAASRESQRLECLHQRSSPRSTS